MFGIPLHKLIIHFPVALTLIALVYDSWAIYGKKPELHQTAYGLILWAAVGALAAVGTGMQLAQLIRVDKGAVTGHAGYAITSTILLVVVAGIRYSAHAREEKDYRIWWLLMQVVAAGMIFATAITGHRL